MIDKTKKISDEARASLSTALPYIAVFGVTAIGIYAITKIWKKVKDIDPFGDDFDFGNDPGLASLFKRSDKE